MIAKFRFTMPDNTSGAVVVTTIRNVTQVTIIVGLQAQYHAKNRNKQIFCGVAYCNPCDKFSITTGIKEACRNALFGGYQLWNTHDYRRSIYSAIRTAMRGTKEN